MKDPMYLALERLRADALQRGMTELAIALGWSLMRLGREYLDAQRSKVSH